MPNGGDGDYATRGTEPSGEAARHRRRPRASALEATAHRRTVGIMRDRTCGDLPTKGRRCRAQQSETVVRSRAEGAWRQRKPSTTRPDGVVADIQSVPFKQL